LLCYFKTEGKILRTKEKSGRPKTSKNEQNAEMVDETVTNNYIFDDYSYFFFACVLYGCETWSLALREEHRLRVFENRVLRRIFEPTRDEMKGDWRKVHNEELHYLYTSSDIIRMVKSRRMGWARHVAGVGGCIIF
jgi:hypothetical protein